MQHFIKVNRTEIMTMKEGFFSALHGEPEITVSSPSRALKHSVLSGQQEMLHTSRLFSPLSPCGRVCVHEVM